MFGGTVDYRHEHVKTEDLTPNPWNSNKVTPENAAKLDASLRNLGMFKPILARETDETLEILGGQHRWESAMRLEMKTVPVVNLGRLTDEEAKIIGLADNSRYGADQIDQLAKILEDISGDITEFLPFSDQDMEDIFRAKTIDLDDLTLPDEEIEDPEPAEKETSSGAQIVRFKMQIEDAERISDLVEKTIDKQGFDGSDALTNAGDALVHLLLR